jgi:hypothetical protein
VPTYTIITGASFPMVNRYGGSRSGVVAELYLPKLKYNTYEIQDITRIPHTPEMELHIKYEIQYIPIYLIPSNRVLLGKVVIQQGKKFP